MPDDDRTTLAKAQINTGSAGSRISPNPARTRIGAICCLGLITAMCCSSNSFGQAVDSDQTQTESAAPAVDHDSGAQTSADAMVIDMRGSQDTQQPSAQESPLVLAFEESIAKLERASGPYATALPEQLLGLGVALQKLDRHEEAIEFFKRGAHLARINGGLYTSEQIALLRQEIRSLLAMGNFEEVDARQEYLYRVERRSLANTEASAYALLEQANWQQQAFMAGIGEEEKLAGRLIVMWDLYRLSMSEMMDHFGEASAELRKPLMGMLKTQYLIAGHQLFNPQEAKRDPVYVMQTGDRYRRGETVLKALAELSTLNKAPVEQIIDDKLALGDWAWWFNKRTEALAFYDQVLAYVAESEDPTAIAYLAAAMAQPLPLPMIEGIQTLPTPQADDAGELVVAFEVTDTGRTVNIERLREPAVEEYEKAIDRLLRALRDVRFRPRFEEGLPVTSDNMLWSWNSEAWRGVSFSQHEE